MSAVAARAGCALALMLAGCTSPPINPDVKAVSFEIPRDTPIRILEATAFRDDRTTVIYGTVRFPVWMESGARRWRIEVTIRLPDGRIIERPFVHLMGEGASVMLGRRAEFATSVTAALPPGTTVRLMPRERGRPD